MGRFRGLRDLVHDAVETITGLVEETQQASAATPVNLLTKVPNLAEPVRQVDDVRKRTSKAVFGTIRAVNRGVQSVGDAVSDLLEQHVGEQLLNKGEAALPPQLSAVLATAADGAQGALNALIGDFLEERGNGLAIKLSFWPWDSSAPLALTSEALRAALPNLSNRLVVFVHGLGCTEMVWHPSAAGIQAGQRADYGATLMTQGFTCLYVRYNTGRHISQNGRELAQRLTELVDAWPVALEQLVLIGHSMGGLVCRSAAHYGAADKCSFMSKLSHLLCIGSPHMGAPLERVGNTLSSLLGMVEVAGTQVPAKILNARSAGIKDLRFGYVLDEEWTEQDPDAFLRDGRRDVPLADNVVYGFLAASMWEGQGGVAAFMGDLLVSVSSASGQHRDTTRHIPFHLGHVLSGVHHQALLTHPEVLEQVQRFLAEPRVSV